MCVGFGVTDWATQGGAASVAARARWRRDRIVKGVPEGSCPWNGLRCDG